MTLSIQQAFDYLAEDTARPTAAVSQRPTRGSV